MPGAHATHEALLEAPGTSLYVPAGHCSNVMLALAAPTAGQKPPGEHGEHSVAFEEMEKVPAGHGAHSVERASSSPYWPGMQGRHECRLTPPKKSA